MGPDGALVYIDSVHIFLIPTYQDYVILFFAGLRNSDSLVGNCYHWFNIINQ